MTMIAVTSASYVTAGAAEHYAMTLLTAYVEADAKLQRHRGDCSKMLKSDLRFALIENSLKLQLCLAEARLVDEIDAHGGTMNIGGKIARICVATLGTDRRRRRWITFK